MTGVKCPRLGRSDQFHPNHAVNDNPNNNSIYHHILLQKETTNHPNPLHPFLPQFDGIAEAYNDDKHEQG